RNPVTIPHGIGDRFRTHDQCPARPECVPAGEYLLYVSKFDVYKHHYEVVLAYAGLPESIRERFALVLAGETDLPEAKRVTNLISEIGLIEQIMLIGAVAHHELPAVYHHAKLVLFASSCENCPNILLEALGSGRPVLSSDVMPMPEFGGDAVVYFSPFEPNRILAAMQTVLSDEDCAARLAAAAVRRSSLYDWARTAGETWTRIFRLLDDARADRG
ncbi:MAG: glycosyltransferase, partial [Methylococcales bacterium]